MIWTPCCCHSCHIAPPPAWEFLNVTQVAQFASSGPAWIDPYTRLVHITCDATTNACGSMGTPDWQPACAGQGFNGDTPTLEEEIAGIKPCTAAEGEMVSQVINNCYSKSGSMVSFTSPCHRRGWKGVQAKVYWPGRFGFINSGKACCGSDNDPGGDKTTNQVKYTTCHERRTCSFHSITSSGVSCGGAAGSSTELLYTYTMDQTSSVDRWGNVTRTGEITIRKRQWNDGSLTADVTYRRLIDTNSYFNSDLPSGDGTLTAECGVISITPVSNLHDATEYHGDLATINALHLFAVANNTSGGACSPTDSGTYTHNENSDGYIFSLSDTTLSMDYKLDLVEDTVKCCVYDPVNSRDVHTEQHNEYHWEVSLGGALAYADILAEANTLLDEWPLNDDAVYPWRTDAKLWLQPLMTYDSTYAEPGIEWGVDEFNNFHNAVGYSGAMRGSPMPAGYERFYNFHHPVWSARSGTYCSACIDSLGTLAYAPLPKTTTEWTSEDEGGAMWGSGAHILGLLTNQFGPAESMVLEGVIVQKWAETLEEWPATNYARPCGRDRYLFDETAVACVVSFFGSALVIDTSPAVVFTIGDVVSVNDGGVYQIAGKTDDQHYTVGGMLYTTPVPCDGASKLRFPAARAVCSKLAVTCVQTADNEVTCTTPSDHWLKGGGSATDTVTFTGVTGLTSAVATWLSSTTFTVPGGTMAAPISGSGMLSTGATAAQIANDNTCSRHDFVRRTSASQHRQAVEFATPEYDITLEQNRIAPIASRPTVLCVSPNTRDVFPHGQTWPFGTIEADQCYGSDWHCDFVQAVSDIYWQADHAPCGYVGGWGMAYAPCVAPGAGEYAYYPITEPRLTPPAGADTPPVSMFDTSAGTGPLGHPGCTIDPYERQNPWSIRALWESCDYWKELIGFKC